MTESQSTFTKESFWSELDSLGEEQVLINLNVKQIYGQVGMSGIGPEKYELAKIWLKKQQDQRDLDAASRRDTREEKTLSIAQEANRIASRSQRWAMYAAIAAVIALIISITQGTL